MVEVDTLRSAMTRTAVAPAIWIAFVLVQALDGAMTVIGIALVGTSIEANPLIAWYVHALGPAPAVVGAKVFAIACGVVLYLERQHHVIAGLVVVYLLFAIGPWLNVLSVVMR